MRFFKWIRVLLQGGRCFKCKYYRKPFCYYDAGFCTRWAARLQLDEDFCADFEKRKSEKRKRETDK